MFIALDGVPSEPPRPRRLQLPRASFRGFFAPSVRSDVCVCLLLLVPSIGGTSEQLKQTDLESERRALFILRESCRKCDSRNRVLRAGASARLI